MTLRLPRADLPESMREALKAQLGSIPDPLAVSFNNPAVALANQDFAAKVGQWNVVDASLKTFAHMAVAALVGCSWCLDINYFLAINQELDEGKASQVPQWRTSTLFSELERDVLEYAEAMTLTPPTVTDELSGRLLASLGADGLVELTVFIGFANLATRANTAHGITSQGYADSCATPLAAPPVRPTFSRRGRRARRMTTDPFSTHRALLFTVAYQVLGSAADAEDAVQEAWVRWARFDTSTIDNARAYLVRIVTHLALDRVRAAARRREDYVGEWLPEPLLTSPDIAEDIVLAESVSMAMMTVLETLLPTERAVFVLRDVFGEPYGEIAQAVGKTEAAVRQIARRARKHVEARRVRVSVSSAEQAEVVGRFADALRSGSLQALMDVLAPDLVLIADGGGQAAAAASPVGGAAKVAGLLAGVDRSTLEISIRFINAQPSVVLNAELLAAVVLVQVDRGRVRTLYVIANPSKLGFLVEEQVLTRDRIDERPTDPQFVPARSGAEACKASQEMKDWVTADGRRSDQC